MSCSILTGWKEAATCTGQLTLDPACLQVRETRTKGDTVGEVAFFFRLRHLNSACAGKTQSTVFALVYTDYQQIAASYVDDDNKVLEALLDWVDSGKSEKSQYSSSSFNTLDSAAMQSGGAMRRKVDQAVSRRTEQNVVKLLNAVATQDARLVQHMLSSEQVEVPDRFSKPVCCYMRHQLMARLTALTDGVAHLMNTLMWPHFSALMTLLIAPVSRPMSAHKSGWGGVESAGD